MSGYGSNFGSGPFSGRGSFFQPPVTPRPALTAIPGGAGAPRNATGNYADPDLDPGLRDFIVRCHKGKTVGRDPMTNQNIVIDWAALQLMDTSPEGGVMHEEPYLPPETDDDELAHKLWERIKQRIRAMYDDGLPHHFLLVIFFADAEGRTANESHDIGPVVLPRGNAEWGSQQGMQQRSAFGAGGVGPMGRGGMGMTHPHHATQEIEMFAMNMAGVRENYGMFGTFMRMLMDENREHRQNGMTVMNLIKDLVADKNKEARLQQEWDMKMALLQGAFERCLPLLQYGGLRVMDLLAKKFDKRPPKTPREMQSFHVIKKIVAGVQSKGMTDPAMLWPMLQGMGVTDESVKDDLTNILMELAIDDNREKAEAQIKANSLVAQLLKPDAIVVAKPAAVVEPEKT